MKNNVKIKDDTQSLQSCVSVSVTDFRIGNLIQRNGVICTVELINGETEEIYFLGKDFYYSDNVIYIEPIQITEEWLLNFGFVLYGKEATDSNSPSDWYWIKKGFKFSIDNLTYLNNQLGVKIKYVHQLQNLYFALVGSELQISNLTEH